MLYVGLGGTMSEINQLVYSFTSPLKEIIHSSVPHLVYHHN